MKKAFQILLFIVLILVVFKLSWGFWVNEGPTLSTFDEENYVITERYRFKSGAWVIPDKMEEDFRIKIKLPRFLFPKTWSVKLRARDNNLIFFRTYKIPSAKQT